MHVLLINIDNMYNFDPGAKITGPPPVLLNHLAVHMCCLVTQTHRAECCEDGLGNQERDVLGRHKNLATSQSIRQYRRALVEGSNAGTSDSAAACAAQPWPHVQSGPGRRYWRARDSSNSCRTAPRTRSSSLRLGPRARQAHRLQNTD